MDFASLADKWVHDLENKGYELVDAATSVAEDVLEAVTSVLEEAQSRIEEIKSEAMPKTTDGSIADFWKGFTDEVAKQAGTVEAEAPVADDLEAQARKAYAYLVSHEGTGYEPESAVEEENWIRYYSKGQSLGDDYWWNCLIENAKVHEDNNTPKVNFDLSSDYDF